MLITPEISYFPWKPACWLRVQGPDAFSFLQGQFSNDLRTLGPSGGSESGEDRERASAVSGALARSVYGLWLDRKGRVLGDGFVLRASEERFYICSYETPAAALCTHLESFIVADEVEVFDETATSALARSVISALAQPMASESAESSGVAGLTLFLEAGADASLDLGQAAFVFGGRRGAPAIEWVGPAEARAELMAQLNPKAELSFEDVERRRISRKIPSVPRDLGSGDLPQEGGADFEQATVSYTKGCYLGQEVMSRLRTMGRVRRSVVFARGEGAVPSALPASLYLGEKRIGEIRSAAADEAPGGFIGLALVSLFGLPTGSVRLSLRPNGPTEVTAEEPTA